MNSSPRLALAASLLAAPCATAGNLDAYFIGNAAGLTAGAITASTRDAEALWYNPAGLALAGVDGRPRSSLEVSGTAFALRYRPLDHTINTNLNLDPAVDHDPDLMVDRSPVDITFDAVGTSLLFARSLSPTLGLGFGLIVPVKDRLRTSDNFTKSFDINNFPSPVEYGQRTELDLSRTEYHAGVAVGWQPTDGLRLGLSAFFVYADLSARGTFWSHISTPTDPTFADITILAESLTTLGVVGAHVAGSVQWDVGNNVTLGLQVRTPTFVITTFSGGSTLNNFSMSVPSSGFPAVSTSSFVDTPDTDGGLDFLRGMKVAAGVVWAFDGGVLALDADVQLGNDNDLGLETDLVWNVRLGARGHVAEHWILGGGVFTDRSGNRSATSLGDTDVDFYGGAFAVEWRKEYGLTGAPSDSLTLATSIGVRYAVGLGDAGSLSYAPFADDVGTQVVTEEAVPVVLHELAIHVGSGVYF